jgi:hypothetical protein
MKTTNNPKLAELEAARMALIIEQQESNGWIDNTAKILDLARQIVAVPKAIEVDDSAEQAELNRQAEIKKARTDKVMANNEQLTGAYSTLEKANEALKEAEERKKQMDYAFSNPKFSVEVIRAIDVEDANKKYEEAKAEADTHRAAINDIHADIAAVARGEHDE